ncbi:MAG: serine--tRNA ligase [Pelagibacteraceae bacterium]|nr:serine--tRNA ligase [Pelagibacteraceae bacterium]
MLILKDIRKNPEIFKQKLKARFIENSDKQIDHLIQLDSNLRTNLELQQEFQNQRNSISKSLGLIKDKKSDEFIKKTKEVSEIKSKISNLEESINQLYLGIDEILHNLPNIPDESVPVGSDENSNKEIKKEGKIRDFEFEPLSHEEIGLNLNQIDFETAVNISGSRFVILKKNIAKLERALINFMIDVHTKENGYTEINVPVLVKEETMFGTGQLPKFKDEQFKTTNNLWLIPTSEVSLTNIVSNQIVAYEQLPLRYVSSSLCFRSEAGAAGKDTKGMMRQHQFTKVELVSIVQPEFRFKELDRLTKSAEVILQKLELPYRVTLLSSGDMGFGAEKTYDLEVWIPSQNKYREISSCSSCGTFQANRMKARYKTIEGKNELLATLNGSGLAVGRTIIAILENYQNKDGTVAIPKVLQSYMGSEIIN